MLCLGCVSKVNSENDEYKSCLPCVGKLCGCPMRVNLRSKNSGKSERSTSLYPMKLRLK
jgi:hypothetical protein